MSDTSNKHTLQHFYVGLTEVPEDDETHDGAPGGDAKRGKGGGEEGGNDKGKEEGDERELCLKCQTDCEGVPD